MKGPTTTPTGGTMESANVAMRRELDLYANVRPTKVPSEDIDWIFFRENTEGEYVLGSKGVEVPDKLAFDFKVTTKAGTERICRAAFEYAKNNGKDYVAIVTKANIMKKTDGNFTKIAHEVAKDYPDIKAEDWFIDIMTANLVNPARRSQFQVFVMPNLYGDIITDEAAQIQGGVGTAGSGNLGDKYCMFEAIHGSAPRMIERGMGEYANPASIIKAAAMLLRHICRAEAAQLLEQIDAMFSNPMVEEWFSDIWDEVYTESAIITKGAKIKRPDRVMVAADRAVVVDYKFGEQNVGNRVQVAQYAKLLQSMGYSNIEGYVWYVREGVIDKVL